MHQFFTRRWFYLSCVIFVSLLVLYPWHNYQDYLSQGDHGRDLYAGQAILRGELPYRNFWWVYGPLMPYVYAAFYALFGVHVTTLILSKIFFYILSSCFIFLILWEFTTPVMAVLAAVWFAIFHQEFFFTYNHIGGVSMVLASAWLLSLYIKEGHLKWALLSLIPIFLCCVIKVNFGLAALVMAIGTVAVMDIYRKAAFTTPKKIFYLLALILVPLLVYLIYAFYLKGLTLMEIRECLPYWSDDQPYNTSPLMSIKNFFIITFQNMRSNWLNMAFAIILAAATVRTALLFKSAPSQYALRFLFLIFLIIFYIFNFHEFLKSGVWYRGFWAQPFSIMMCYLLFDLATASSPAFVRKIVICFLIFMGFISWQNNVGNISKYKIPQQALTADGQPLYLTNQAGWIQTVEQTTAFLRQTLKSDELFFALPYDCLYYYLTSKKTPTRQLIFFQHIKIPRDQEERIIAELEANNTKYVVMSSRAYAHEEYGLGVFGKDYCPLLAAYIKEHYQEITRFGDWTNEPGWAWNHGTMVLKRKE